MEYCLLNKQPYKGTRDFFPHDKRILDYIFERMRCTAESFGYESYDGPLLEDIELYKAKSGEELINEQIYDFTDRGERHVAIRPEMTPTLARMVAQIHREYSKPLRWYSIPNLMRYEKPQKGRVREHWQFNCDIFGAPGRMGEVEILDIAISLLKSFGANSSQFEVLINDRQVIDVLFTKILKLNSEESTKMIKLIDRSKKLTPELLEKQIAEFLKENKSVTIFYDYLKLQNFEELFTFLDNHGHIEAVLNLKSIMTPLQALGLIEFIKFDPTIARGLDYYTGIVFEIFDKNPENRRAICGGGAYADLLKIFDEPSLPGVGLGLGDVTLLDFLKTHKLLPEKITQPHNDIQLCTDQADSINTLLSISDKLRKSGLKVIVSLDVVKFNKVFKDSEKNGADFVGLIGENEKNNCTIQIKEMKNRIQKEFKLNDINDLIIAIKKKSL